jgi:hypothetical protein
MVWQTLYQRLRLDVDDRDLVQTLSTICVRAVYGVKASAPHAGRSEPLQAPVL